MKNKKMTFIEWLQELKERDEIKFTGYSFGRVKISVNLIEVTKVPGGWIISQ